MVRHVQVNIYFFKSTQYRLVSIWLLTFPTAFHGQAWSDRESCCPSFATPYKIWHRVAFQESLSGHKCYLLPGSDFDSDFFCCCPKFCCYYACTCLDSQARCAYHYHCWLAWIGAWIFCSDNYSRFPPQSVLACRRWSWRLSFCMPEKGSCDAMDLSLYHCRLCLALPLFEAEGRASWMTAFVCLSICS